MPKRRLGAIHLVAVGAVVLAACGSRLEYSELEAQAAGAGSGEQASATTPAGDLAGDSSATLDPATGETGTDPAAGGTGGAAPGGTVGGTSGGASASSAAACAPNCSPLIIGTVGTYSGIVGQNVVGGVRALQAWAQSINAAGGLNGHPVKVVVADDAGDPARHRALLQQLVEEQKVVAFVYNAAPLTGQASIDYLNKAKIPVLGTENTGEWSYQSQYYFPQALTGLSFTAAGFGFPGDQKKVGIIYCSDGAQVCENAKTAAPKYASQLGKELVYVGSGSLAAPDYTAQCLAARDKGVEVLLPVMDGNAMQRIARSCASVGYRPKISVGQPSQNDAIANDPNFDGNYGVNATIPATDTSNAGVVEMRAAMARYAPGLSLTGSPMQGWVSAKMLEAAGPSISEPPTAQSIMDGLYKLNGSDLGGITSPLTFVPGQIAPRTICWWPLKIEGGEFVAAGSRQCRNDIQV